MVQDHWESGKSPARTEAQGKEGFLIISDLYFYCKDVRLHKCPGPVMLALDDFPAPSSTNFCSQCVLKCQACLICWGLDIWWIIAVSEKDFKKLPSHLVAMEVFEGPSWLFFFGVMVRCTWEFCFPRVPHNFRFEFSTSQKALHQTESSALRGKLCTESPSTPPLAWPSQPSLYIGTIPACDTCVLQNFPVFLSPSVMLDIK